MSLSAPYNDRPFAVVCMYVCVTLYHYYSYLEYVGISIETYVIHCVFLHTISIIRQLLLYGKHNMNWLFQFISIQPLWVHVNYVYPYGCTLIMSRGIYPYGCTLIMSRGIYPYGCTLIMSRGIYPYGCTLIMSRGIYPYGCTLIMSSGIYPYACTLIMSRGIYPYGCTLIMSRGVYPYGCTLIMSRGVYPYGCTLIMSRGVYPYGCTLIMSRGIFQKMSRGSPFTYDYIQRGIAWCTHLIVSWG